MESKVKKIILIAVLVVIIVAIIFVIWNSSSGKKEQKVDSSTTTVGKVAQSENIESNQEQSGNVKTKEKEVTITQLESGTKYSVTDEDIEPEIVIGDNYFGTQLNDINLNFSKYEGKTIEVEGLYFQNEPYTFVGRYSTTSVCADCPTGFSYFEYEWDGKETLPVTDSESWMKMVGTLKKGNDGVEYYYIDVANVEIMNEKGLDTVNN